MWADESDDVWLCDKDGQVICWLSRDTAGLRERTRKHGILVGYINPVSSGRVEVSLKDSSISQDSPPFTGKPSLVVSSSCLWY